MKTLRVYGKADHLIPEGWRWRIACAPLNGGGYELLDPKTKTRLAVIVPEGDGSHVVADGNMVTRWYTLEDAVLYAAQARGEWDRPWPFKMRQFWGDRLRYPFGSPEADYDQGDDSEVDGWPDDPRWRALFDSTVWYPGERVS